MSSNTAQAFEAIKGMAVDDFEGITDVEYDESGGGDYAGDEPDVTDDDGSGATYVVTKVTVTLTKLP